MSEHTYLQGETIQKVLAFIQEGVENGYTGELLLRIHSKDNVVVKRSGWIAKGDRL